MQVSVIKTDSVIVFVNAAPVANGRAPDQTICYEQNAQLGRARVHCLLLVPNFVPG